MSFKKPKIYRCWINQPSNLQYAHHLHGRHGIAVDYGEPSIQVFFVVGSCISTTVMRDIVSRC